MSAAGPYRRAAATAISRGLCLVLLAASLCGLPARADSDQPPQSSPLQSEAVGVALSHAPARPHDCRGFYPDQSLRHAEAGEVVVRYDIGADGALTNLQVAYSSGFARLDEAALACVGSAGRPAATDGTPVVAVTGHLTLISFALMGVDSAERAFQRGMAREAMGNDPRAIEQFSQAILADPGYIQAYRVRALAYDALGQTDLAKADRAKADALDKQH